MNARHRLPAAAALALSATAVLADPHLRPGLWEQTVNVKSDDPQQNAAMAQMQQRLAAMPPEQRAAIEKMMAGRGLAMGSAPNSLRVCVTREQAERGFSPESNGNGHCTRTNVSTAGSTTTFDFACKSERSTVTGHGTFTASGDSAFTARTTADTVSPNHTLHLQSEIAGRFLSADCGDVKPIQPPPAAR